MVTSPNDQVQMVTSPNDPVQLTWNRIKYDLEERGTEWTLKGILRLMKQKQVYFGSWNCYEFFQLRIDSQFFLNGKSTDRDWGLGSHVTFMSRISNKTVGMRVAEF
jgi:hypothetical protein